MGLLRSVNGEFAKDLIMKKDGRLRAFCVVSTWCEACQEMGIQVGILAEEYPELRFYRIEYSRNEQWIGRYMGEAVPYFMVVKNGKQLVKVEGYEDREKLSKKLEELF